MYPHIEKKLLNAFYTKSLNYIQLYSPEYTLAENININSNIQNKDRNILINIIQLKIRNTFVKVLTKDITEDAVGKFPHAKEIRNSLP